MLESIFQFFLLGKIKVMGLSNVFVLFFECVHELVKHLVPLVSSERRHSFATYKLQFTKYDRLVVFTEKPIFL